MKAQASPNIALIKYWGKKSWEKDEDKNIGLNPSLSMTLSKALTTTEVVINSNISKDSLSLNGNLVDGQQKQKVCEHLDRLFTWAKCERVPCTVISHNNFPTGAGIASSASAFTALTLAGLAEIKQHNGIHSPINEELSSLSRRGSGSAARSTQGPFMYWDNYFAKVIGPTDWLLYDTVIFLSTKHKSVSSSEGHQRALSSPLFEARLKQIDLRTQNAITALNNKDIHSLGAIIEEEALEMHKIMESSEPPIYYRNKACIALLNEIESIKDRDFYWTLDAGPNPHIISERPIKPELEQLLSKLGIEGQIWEDFSGFGPKLLE